MAGVEEDVVADVVDKKNVVKCFDNKKIVIIFDKNFVVMKNVIGTPARGEHFFPREIQVQTIIDHLSNGNNLQIAAPRRIGKTSILWYLLDNGLQGYVYVYIDTEAVNDENEFFKKLLKELLRVEQISGSGTLRSLFQKGEKFLKRIKSIRILDPGIEFSDDAGPVDYKEDLVNFLLGMQLDNGARLVILLDEFPQTIQNIVDRHNGDLQPAKKFLQSNREIRLNPDIASKVSFIITGSIGLNHTVAAISSSAFINDLASVEVDQMTENEARDFLQALLQPRQLQISKHAEDYMLKRIEWLIPFHIQLAVQEIIQLARKGLLEEVTTDLIDKAFDSIVQLRNNNHFEHYLTRLKKQFKGEALSYVIDLLDRLAREGTIERTAIVDLSVKYHLHDHWRHVIETLMYDGYINNSGDANTYRFNSPIVRMWWQRFAGK